MRIVHMVVRGRVQGVGYRAWCQSEARRRGLSGWVHNRPDGAVAALIAGEDAAVTAMLDACRIGPPRARVDDLVWREAVEDAAAAGDGFAVLDRL